MARVRFIRPEFFTDEKAGSLPYGARLLFPGIWCHSDLNGVFEYSAKQLRVLVFPHDEGLTSITVQEWLDKLESLRLIVRFEVDGKAWGFVRNWDKYQSISTREKQVGSRHPHPPSLPCHARVDPVSDMGHACVVPLTLTPTPTLTPASAVTLTREDRPPPDRQDIFSSGEIPAKVCRSKTLGDLETCFPRLIILREDRGKAEATLALFGWDACSEGLTELGPIAEKRPSNRRRIFVSELSAWLNNNFTPEPEDYQRAGLPIPEGKT